MNIYEKARKGLALDETTVIDCHCHIGFWYNFHAPRNNAEGMLESMDALGVDTACVTAHSSIGPDYRFGNDIVMDAVQRYPGRFLGYATVNPNYADDMKNELGRCLQVEGMKGIKLHPSMHGCPIDYKNYHTAYETAEEKGYPVLIHVWGLDDVMKVDKLAGQYPNAKFIMGHAGAEIPAMAYAVDVVARCANAYVDLALSMVYEGNVEWLVREMGSHKVLYGSDMPFFDPRPAFGRVVMADMSDEDKRNVLGLNMKRLLGV